MIVIYNDGEYWIGRFGSWIGYFCFFVVVGNDYVWIFGEGYFIFCLIYVWIGVIDFFGDI